MPSIYNDVYSTNSSNQHPVTIQNHDPDLLTAPPTTRFVSAMCGSGKTHALAHLLKNRITSFAVWKAPNYVYVCQSKRLMKQFAAHLHSLGIKKTHLFNSDLNDKVVIALRDFIQLESHVDGGHVVLITHQAYLFAAQLIDRRQWSVYIDEIPQITVAKSQDIQFSNSWLAGIIEGKQFNAELIELFPTNHKALDDYLKSQDEGITPFRTLLHALKSKNHRCFATVESYHTLKAATLSSKKADFRLCYITLVDASLFTDTTILAANVERSMLYDHLVRHGIQMIRDKELTEMLRYHEYPAKTCNRLRIEYLIKRKYSKTLSGKEMECGSTVKTAMDQRVIERIGKRKSLLLKNEGDEGALAKSPYVEHLPPKSSGMNNYSRHTTIICMVAYNRNHTDVKLHRSLGFSENSIRHTTLVEEIHQAIMRTNLRVMKSRKEVLVIVTDAVVADEIVQLVGCANATIVAGPDIIPKYSSSSKKEYQPLTKTQINQRNMANNYFSYLGLNESDRTDESMLEAGDSMGCNYLKSIDIKCPIETSITNTLPDQHILSGKKSTSEKKSNLHEVDMKDFADEYLLTFTFHNKKDDYKPEQFKTDTFTLRQMVNRLKCLASTVYDKKDQRRMYNPAEFEPFECDHRYRTKFNWLSASAMVLDFDNGDVSPDDFIRIFFSDCTDAEKIAFIIYNSFSRSDKEPNRFHVVIPYLTPIFDLEVHEAIFDYIESRLAKAGYPPKKSAENQPKTSGLDHSLRSGVQSLYCPCTNRKHPQSAFFKTFGMDKKQFGKFGLNPTGFKTSLELPVAIPASPKPISVAKSPQQYIAALRAIADREVEAIRNMPSGRHVRFFKLAHLLWHCRYHQAEALAKMLYAAKGEVEMIKKAHHNIKRAYNWDRKKRSNYRSST